MTRVFGGSVLALGVLTALGGIAHAQPRGGHRGPPPEAFTACNGQQAGAACSVTFGQNTLRGTCTTTPDQRVACRPEGMPPPPNGGQGPGQGGPPPQE